MLRKRLTNMFSYKLYGLITHLLEFHSSEILSDLDLGLTWLGFQVQFYVQPSGRSVTNVKLGFAIGICRLRPPVLTARLTKFLEIIVLISWIQYHLWKNRDNQLRGLLYKLSKLIVTFLGKFIIKNITRLLVLGELFPREFVVQFWIKKIKFITHRA